MGGAASCCKCFNNKASESKDVPLDPKKQQNDIVSKELLEQEIEKVFKFKILLLGAGESGKSTVVKQLKRIHQKKMTKQEWDLVATSLHQGLVDCFKALFQAVKSFGTHTLSPKGVELHETLNSLDDNSMPLTPEIGALMDEVWKGDEAIQNAYSRRSEFWLLDAFEYYMSHVTRFCSPSFQPTDDDSVMARIRTTGIVTTQLEQKINATHEHEPKSIKFEVVDVGGQRNERKKWLHCFDDVNAILFCVNLAGYNQVLFEDTAKNRMHEALELFGKIANNDIFLKTPIFLWLNKKDIFETMIGETDMKTTFPKYQGGKNMQNALEFIQKEFESHLPPKKEIQAVQVISAKIKFEIVSGFEDVKKTLYDQNRKQLLDKVGQLMKNYKAIDHGEPKTCGCPCCCCCWFK